MKPLRNSFRQIIKPTFNRFRDLSMTKKISMAFLLVIIPMVILVGVWFVKVMQNNEHYGKALRNTSLISEFSLDFKKDYDYKIYLIVAGSKSYASQDPITDIQEAKRIITEAENMTENADSRRAIQVTKKYLDKLQQYTEKIHINILEGGHYEENREIWETGIQSITSCIQENVLEILYYENRQGAQIYNSMQAVTEQLLFVSILVFIGLFIFAILMITIIPRTITKPVRNLIHVTEQAAGGDLTVRADIRHGVELKALGNSLNTMIEKISSLIERVTEEQTRLREAELEILQMQINPHFLYNTLDTIIWLAEAEKKESVMRMVENLSEFFRSSLKGGRDIVPIESETRHISSYLEIQQVRYQDILDYEIRIPQDIGSYLIPKITLQPLVENALYHGIKYKRGRGKILVSGRRREDSILLTVEDDGIGMTEERLQQVQEGLVHGQKDSSDFNALYNVNQRIRLKFGNSYGLRLYSRHTQGTRVEVCLPLQKNIN